MARIRSIKPEFFTDEDLGDLPPLVRLFFAGLWCHADKEGRLKYQPRELKAKILPYDRQYSANKCVELLQSKRCVRTYEADGVAYLEICNWHKHQKPHHTERDSTIPPPENNGYLTVKERTEGKGKEGKGKEGKEVREQDANEARPEGQNQSPDEQSFSVDFWPRCPRKVGKVEALRAFVSARKKLSKLGQTPAEARAFLVERMAAFAATPKARGQYCPHPSTWLNQGRYDDDPAEWEKTDGRANEPYFNPGGRPAVRSIET